MNILKTIKALNIVGSVKNFIDSSRRVLIVAKKPSMMEFSAMSKVTGLGITVIAVIGFIIILIFTFFGLGS